MGLGLQQILKVSVNLQKPFTVPRNRRKGGKSYNFVKIYLLWQSQPTTPIPRRKPRTFLEEIIQESIAKGDTRVQTRFPPEPNGYLHIGHAKSICINFGLAKKYGGKCNLRFDDTNPVKEDVEYVDSIKRDIRWLGFDWALERYASDYFDQALRLGRRPDQERIGLCR